MTLNVGRIQAALLRYFDWQQNSMMSEFWVDGGWADLVVITRAGYLTEIEIKTSISDFRADLKKYKWELSARPSVSRFFFAVPEELEAQVLAELPAGSGLLVVQKRRYRDEVRCVLDAPRRRSEKIKPERILEIHRNCYYRFWRQHLRSLQDRRPVEVSA